MEAKIEELYNDPTFGLVSRDKFYRKIKRMFPSVTREQVMKIVDGIPTEQITRQPKRPRVFNSIVSSRPGVSYQIDLMVYDRYEYHKYKYILMCIDVYSRYLMAVPLTTRRFPEIMKALKDIFKVMGIPKYINCDNEFNNHEFNSYCKEHGIKVYFSSPDETNKNAIVERVNRTIASMLQRYRIAHRKYDWYNWLPKIVANYNSTYHSGIKAVPLLVWEGKEESHQKITSLPDPIKVGDYVLAQVTKTKLDKGDKPHYGKEVYKVVEKEGRKNILEREDGSIVRHPYKSYELLKIEPRKTDSSPPNEEEEIHQKTVLDKKVAKALRKRPEEVPQDIIANRTRRKKIDYKALLNPLK